MTNTINDRVSITIENGVADVRLVRTDKMNALDDAMFLALIEAVDQVSNDSSVRCVVISGEGRAFCAGLDMGRMQSLADSGDSSERADSTGSTDKEPEVLGGRDYGIANRAQQAVWGWRTCPVPVIAAVHGVAFGGGFQLTLGADIRITHPETKLAIMEVKWGLVPDMAGTAIMHTLAREDVVRELTYTGRIFSGTEAKEYGFATIVSEDPYADALAMAKDIASKSPDAIQADKLIFNSISELNDAELLLQESVIQGRLIGSANQSEAVAAGMQKRAANFQD
jgi:enoyl-CoA hydratase/carnithine racemase